MRFVIEKIILWPRRPELERREIDLQTDKVNVIEGHMLLGKISALLLGLGIGTAILMEIIEPT
jgi:hypothetical protein